MRPSRWTIESLFASLTMLVLLDLRTEALNAECTDKYKFEVIRPCPQQHSVYESV
jgi:hypothetical protein